ncbi:CRISPR-associated protein Csn1 [Marixanthomonas sp. SCSIO 43207]|uniref:type II CRISPR RNA-guided endonuclease Cas9 n=1 Tax=Marixanthomonas sp. SCSIO 43207 TaxID=2779360 RepID=UPI001CA9D711|nr:type II CRISPR RNA-guided endonuclease Cas9 [Marixanthomonas sp. SCSIO 43207]UAB81328.1 CRISPR-associated protein Csn1 [Marixanthomonas sp. SCSIO 43207]
MKRILGPDLGTNSIGWALVESNFNKKEGKIIGLGSRIIPMDAKQMNDFSTGQSISATADRTAARSMRRLYQRSILRRERLHRVLNILGFLPDHYANSIDFEKRYGQFKKGTEPKLPYRQDEENNFHFIFQDSFNEMVSAFKAKGQNIKLPYDWTLYYLRKKALKHKISKQELSWVLLNFNQKRGYYQSRDEDLEGDANKLEEYYKLKVVNVEESDKAKGGIWYNVLLENKWVYRRKSKDPLIDWIGKDREFIVTTTLDKKGKPKKDKEGNIKRSFRSVDSEKDWIAIKKKTENEILDTEKTVGEYIFDTLLKKPDQKIRGKLIKTIERKFYRKELDKIIETQLAFHPELQNAELYQKSINELYRNNDAHRANITDKGFKYLFIDDIIFYQRPLKTNKSLISNCPFESRTYIKDGEKVEQPLKCISKSHPLYQEFRLWQFIHNLRIYQREGIEDGNPVLDQDVTNKYLKEEKDNVDLYDFLNQRKEISQKALLKYFKLTEKEYRWNYIEDKKYPCNELRAEIISRLSKIEGVNPKDYLNPDFIFGLWHIIYSVRDRKQYGKALKTFASKNNLNEDAFFEAFIKFKPFDSAYGSFSEKALKKLLPLMRQGKYWDNKAILEETQSRINFIMERLDAIGRDLEKIEKVADDDIPKQVLKSFTKASQPNRGLNTYQASYAVYNRHAEVSEIIRWTKPDEISKYLKGFKQHSLRNPIVEQVVTETLRVVRDIWEFYGEGKENYFDEIHVELGREIKNSADVRESITNAINQNTNTNERIKNILQQLMDDKDMEGSVRPYSKGHQEILKLYEEGVYSHSPESYNNIELGDIEKIRRKTSPTKSEINKYKLWLQQGYVSPYTGEIIPLSKLFTSEYEVEHIIPRSRYFDDSISNKVICEAAINPYPYKGNKTAYQFIKDRGDSIVPELSVNGKNVKILSKENYEAHCKTYFKDNKKKLEFLLSDDIPEGFINRQLNDSRYISKIVKGLLSNVVREEGEQETTSKHLVPVIGKITSVLRQDWGLSNVWNDLLAPRFERMNEITNSTEFRFEKTDGHGNTYMVNTVPDELANGFTKKRLDHRHHALDALVVAFTTKEHTNYVTSLNTKRKNYGLVSKLRQIDKKTIPDKKNGGTRTITVAKDYHKPWHNFTQEAKEALETTIVSFKQNKRVINRATNKYWKWKEVDGKMKKIQVEQKGSNWAIRKSLHKATYYGKTKGVDTPKGKIATAGRVSLESITNRKQLNSITDSGIKKILNNHLKNYIDEKEKERFDLAFSPDGIDELNNTIQQLNNGKPHQPIKKVRVYEIGSKFSLGETGNKDTKYVEADKGTNLFFNVYWDEKKEKRNYETVPLNEVVAHQKAVASLPKEERTEAPTDPKLGKFLFSLSPDDLVYVPTDEEMDNPTLVNFENLSKEQAGRIYKMVSTTQKKLQCQPMPYAKEIKKNENGSGNKTERILAYPNKENIIDEKNNLVMIKDRCWKLLVDRLGNLKRLA